MEQKLNKKNKGEKNKQIEQPKQIRNVKQKKKQNEINSTVSSKTLEDFKREASQYAELKKRLLKCKVPDLHLEEKLKQKQQAAERKTMEMLEQLEAFKIDVCFLIDSTGSMEPWLATCSKTMDDIIHGIKIKYPKSILRVAFVGYRDIDDPKLFQEERFVIFPFSEDYDTLSKNIQGVRATGGGTDGTEDVFGGLEKSLELEWKNKNRVLIHFADYPGHGQLYHDLGIQLDDYYSTDLDGSIGKSIMEAVADNGIQYVFCRLLPKTDKMISKFREYYDGRKDDMKLIVNEISDNMTQWDTDIEKFLPAVISSIALTVEATVQRVCQEMGASVPAVEDIPLGSVVPQWDDNDSFGPVLRVKIYSTNNKNPRNPLQRETKVRIGKLPFAKGSIRYAYFMKEENTNFHFVAKRNIRTSEIYLKKSSYMVEMETQAVAFELAKEFNKKDAGLKLHFLPVRVMEVLDQDKPIFYNVENYIEGDYEKYTNNNGWLGNSELANSVAAFSHFTHHHTKGQLMVVDLQGVNTILTDPVIHCISTEAFGKTNLGKPGMKRFFQTHKCNTVCGNLDMKCNRHQRDQTAPEKGVVNITVTRQRKPCEAYCGVLLEESAKSNFCKTCNQMLKVKETRKCNREGCGKEFKEAPYDFERKGMAIPKKCLQCRLMKKKLKKGKQPEAEKHKGKGIAPIKK
jgi:hypothetical protein